MNHTIFKACARIKKAMTWSDGTNYFYQRGVQSRKLKIPESVIDDAIKKLYPELYPLQDDEHIYFKSTLEQLGYEWK